jgi:hypothetical protein
VTLTEATYRRWLIALILAAAILRLVGLNWDEGRGLHPDEGNLVRAALALGRDGQFLPDFHAYNDLALWLPRLVSLPFCDLADRACLTHAARLVSAGFSLATVPLAATLARRLGGAEAGPVAGLAAAAAFAASAPLVQWAHFGTTESLLAFLVVALWLVAAEWQAGRVSDRQMALWSALLLGAGFGFKTTVVVFAVVPLTALVLAGKPDAARLRLVLAATALAAALALATTPSLLLATKDWLQVMRFEGGVVAGTTPVFWTAQFHGKAAGLYEARQLWSATSGAGLVLALSGLVLMPRASWRLAIPGLLLALVYLVVISGWHAKFFRYLAPLLPVLLILAGLAIGRIATPLRSQSILALGLAGLGWMALAGLDQTAGYLRTDPRIAVETRLLVLSSAEETVAIEPHDLAQTGGRTGLLLPLTDPAVDAVALATPLGEAGWLIIASRRNWEVLPRQPSAMPVICSFYARIADGSLGYVPVFRQDRRGPFGKLFAPGLQVEETRTVFDGPDVILFRNVERLPPEEIALRLAEPHNPATCAGEALARAWRRGR